MGLEEVKAEILSKAKKESEDILSAAREEARKSVETAKSKISERKIAEDEKTKSLLEHIEMKERAGASFEARKAMFNTKKEILSDVFDKVNESLSKLPEAKNKTLLKHLSKRTANEIEVKHVYSNKKDKKMVHAMFRNASWNEMPLIGGFIAENSDMTMRVDYSYETLLETLREKHVHEVSSILFK